MLLFWPAVSRSLTFTFQLGKELHFNQIRSLLLSQTMSNKWQSCIVDHFQFFYLNIHEGMLLINPVC